MAHTISGRRQQRIRELAPEQARRSRQEILHTKRKHECPSLMTLADQ